MGRSSLTVASCACRLATAKVVVTDRLHGSIFAFLNGKPHIYIDQMYKKIERTREVAFRHSDACRQKKVLMYDAADGLQDAFLKAVRFLRQLEDEEPVTAEAGRKGGKPPRGILPIHQSHKQSGYGVVQVLGSKNASELFD